MRLTSKQTVKYMERALPACGLLRCRPAATPGSSERSTRNTYEPMDDQSSMTRRMSSERLDNMRSTNDNQVELISWSDPPVHEKKCPIYSTVNEESKIDSITHVRNMTNKTTICRGLDNGARNLHSKKSVEVQKVRTDKTMLTWEH